MGSKASGGKKQRKHGRSKIYCEAYRREHREERNKAVRLVKHVAKQPNDACGQASLDRCYAVVSEREVARFIKRRSGNHDGPAIPSAH